MIAAFVIWTVLAVVFLGLGIKTAGMEKPAGFFANVKAPEVKDVAGYNRAVSRLWIRYAVLFEVIGIPFLFLKQNSPLFLLVALAAVFLSLGLMIAYMNIESRYRA
ncbi:MAG: hypothetical protein IKE28_00040 [Solobacterium sp.]|nr:hypothetical protein [Solobacterium sp.]